MHTNVLNFYRLMVTVLRKCYKAYVGFEGSDL